jgi:hypothetical protein
MHFFSRVGIYVSKHFKTLGKDASIFSIKLMTFETKDEKFSN